MTLVLFVEQIFMGQDYRKKVSFWLLRLVEDIRVYCVGGIVFQDKHSLHKTRLPRSTKRQNYSLIQHIRFSLGVYKYVLNPYVLTVVYFNLNSNELNTFFFIIFDFGSYT